MSYRHALPRVRFASFRLYFIINEIRSINEATIDAVHYSCDNEKLTTFMRSAK